VQVPVEQVAQGPGHWMLQQTPPAPPTAPEQTPCEHSASAPQVAAGAFFALHLPVAASQYVPSWQSWADVHVVLHALALHTALPHDWVAGVTQVPMPSQAGGGVYVLPEHVALPHDWPLARFPQ
jgi:hypothetical protein